MARVGRGDEKGRKEAAGGRERGIFGGEKEEERKKQGEKKPKFVNPSTSPANPPAGAARGKLSVREAVAPRVRM